MLKFNLKKLTIQVEINNLTLQKWSVFFEENASFILTILLSLISCISFLAFYENNLGLAYNDARSHLDIGRRVVEGLKPGLAQLGSVWLPLPHALMIPTIWNNFMWHSGLSGALVNMVSFVATAMLIYYFLKELGVGLFGRLLGVAVFVANLNILYLQSTAMTELLLLATMTAGIYELVKWHKNNQILTLIKSAFWIMTSTLVRYDGWFLLVFASILIIYHTAKNKGLKTAEGTLTFFLTLSGLGIFLWFVWNQLIFDDALYFMFGPYSAHTQQQQLSQAGVLATKGNILLSIKVYLYAMIYNSGVLSVAVAIFGMAAFWLAKKNNSIKMALTALLAPLVFNILALFLGHSVLFIQGIPGNTWFNVRYGVMMLPSIAIFVGYLTQRFLSIRPVIIGLFIFVTFFHFTSFDAVTIDDARVGSSQKNVTEVAGWLRHNAREEKGFVLISAASHDAIIFSSGLPMKKFIHEGTGAYWESATTAPDRWARWIVMRTNDTNDAAFKLVNETGQLDKYELINSYPFADIYQLRPQYLGQLNTEPTLAQK